MPNRQLEHNYFKYRRYKKELLVHWITWKIWINWRRVERRKEIRHVASKKEQIWIWDSKFNKNSCAIWQIYLVHLGDQRREQANSKTDWQVE